MSSIPAPALELRDLAVRFAARGGPLVAVAGVSLRIAPGECVGIIGESGAGKSQALLAPFRLTASDAQVGGMARLAGEDLLAKSEAELDRVRGARAGFVFQDPMSSLTPHRTVGEQIIEVLECHGRAHGAAARTRTLELLEQVRIDDAARRLSRYPHELSGGQRQRVAIAIAIACDPPLLIADEPTTALDVTVQAGILELLAALKRERHMAMALVSHDFGVIARLADRILVMYAGRVVEEGTAAALVAAPRHPYTAALLECLPRLDDPPGAPWQAIPGQPPDPRALPAGCAFHPRCPRAAERCRVRQPQLDGGVACHLPVSA
ncbi:MAG TPA: ABC transporter ATP-binding protein [Steroidobacteraceae bacterium]|nr:ABC transporter ATP-binding protein [Steroidobacteraceae bacterium]HNS27166.1 ABC transporter ATP-binding protein [Steroidobacteraceae bacterium]